MTNLLYERGFLKDDQGNLSIMRLLSFMTWFLLAFVVVYQTIKDTYNIWVILVLGSLAFVPKVFQKIVEARANVTSENK